MLVVMKRLAPMRIQNEVVDLLKLCEKLWNFAFADIFVLPCELKPVDFDSVGLT
jgi:hypothetical protein